MQGHGAQRGMRFGPGCCEERLAGSPAVPGLSTLALFLDACLALSVTPGPDTMLVASRSASRGRRAAVPPPADIQAGIRAHARAAALGPSQLLAAG